MVLRWINKLIFFIFIGIVIVSSNDECPEKCDKEQCQKIDDCENLISDQCDCCQICVRQVGGLCGTPSQVCDSHLTCHQETDLSDQGHCIKMTNDSCLSAPCRINFNPKCPEDSRLIIPPPPEGECCGPPAKCHCDPQKCVAFVPTCGKNEELRLIKKGIKTPGKCCDVFECKTKEKKCANVHCPIRTFDEDEGSTECPADSFRQPEYTTQESCCPIRPACKCRASVCRPARCQDGEKVKVLKKGNGTPGRCCDEWKCESESKGSGKKCVHDGKEYDDGFEWHSSICDVCKCKKGIAICTKMTCPKINPQCTWIVIPDGECCPVCFGCQTDELEKKKKHETWQKDDCTTCTCSEEGGHVCEKHMCKTDCENPRKVDGQCCPVCDEPSIVKLPVTCPSLDHCSLRCANGLRRDNVGCYLCECLPEDVPMNARCQELNDENCDKQCAHGYLNDNDGCLTCKCAKCPPLHQCFKHCLYGFETNSAGCPLCKCRASSKLDKKQNAQKKMTKIGHATSEKCVSFSADGHQIERDGGEWWSDGCRHCFCEDQQEFCSLISCPSRPLDCDEEMWIQKEGECCPTCVDTKHKSTKLAGNALSARQQKHEHTVCQSPGTGRLFTDGETWQLAPCVSCTCRVGHVLCRTNECPPIACSNPEYLNDDDCCPICPEQKVLSTKNEDGEVIVCTDDTGAAHIVGASWRQDDCTSCICMADGTSDCYKEACDESLECRGNPLVIKGKCCPVCSDALSSSAVCSYQSTVYSIGEQWQDGHCSNCSCVSGGQTICRQMVCPHCVDTVPIEGHCCPLCKDAGWAPYGIGNGSGETAFPPGFADPRIRTHNGVEATPAFSLLIVSLMSLAVVGLLIVLLLLYKKNRKSNKLHKFNEVGHMSSGGTSTVCLSGSKPIGSMPRLVDWKDKKDCSDDELIKKGNITHIRYDSQNSDDQSDSLLSSMSDTSTAPSTVSSGHAPISDTQPLTPNRSRRLPV